MPRDYDTDKLTAAPLAEHIRAFCRRFETDEQGRNTLARRAKVATKTIDRILTEPDKRIQTRTADTISLALGVHPVEIWPDEWLEVACA